MLETNRKDLCGDASKVLFKRSPYDYEGSPYYDARFKGHIMLKSTYRNGSPTNGTMDARDTRAHKNAWEPDPSKFVGSNWMENDHCKDDAPSCTAGLNYDPWNNVCADSASGWNSSTPASACRYVQHKCDKHNIFYYPPTGTAILPLTQSNIDLFGTSATGGWGKKRYRYEYVFKKWMECTAKDVIVTVDDDDTDGAVATAEPDGWDCEVEKRCVCLSCTMGSLTDEAGDKYYTGEPCSCDAIPPSVQGTAAGMCAQT